MVMIVQLTDHFDLQVKFCAKMNTRLSWCKPGWPDRECWLKQRAF